jgi:hypothetical protein
MTDYLLKADNKDTGDIISLLLAEDNNLNIYKPNSLLAFDNCCNDSAEFDRYSFGNKINTKTDK